MTTADPPMTAVTPVPPAEATPSTAPLEYQASAPRKRRSLRTFFWRRRGVMRGLTLVLATALSLFGTIGQFYFVDSLDDTVAARVEEMRAIETRTETLRTSQSAYFNAQVQGNMLFALNPADRSVNKGVVGDLYSLALYDRAFPFRSILGELAIAGAIDFKTVNDRYNGLREAAMKDFSYAPFMAVGEFERQILDQAMTLHGALQDRYWTAADEKSKAEAEAARRRAALLAVTGVATCLFLLANLMGVKD
jgi:hypothetical protein